MAFWSSNFQDNVLRKQEQALEQEGEQEFTEELKHLNMITLYIPMARNDTFPLV